MKLTFYGAAGEVTGSCYLVEADGVRFLVDCGMFQGGREAEEKNRRALDFDLESIDFVVLTHAHIDHSGLLPRLVALGFNGPVYATSASCDLLKVVLKDSAHIQEREAEWENYSRHKQRRHAFAHHQHETAPLYTLTQAERALKRLRPVDYDAEIAPHPAVRVRFRDAGHIIGSAIIELWVTERGKTRKFVFSGDLGQPERPIVCDPTTITGADVLIVESTYGNRLHKNLDETLDELVAAISHTLERKKGNVVIPAFAVGRTQDLLFLLYRLHREGRLSNLNIYVDSPMALAATEITFRHLEILDGEAREMMRWQRDGGDMPRIVFTQEKEESMAINAIRSGAIIISSSGMCEAGRIKYHLRYNLPRPESSVLITGFQAAGSLGRRLVDGAETVHIFGDEVPVHADVYTIGGLSAHGDQKTLLRWLSNFRDTPARTFVVHGEAGIAQGFADLIRDRLGWSVDVPGYRSSIELD